ncbi:hypothetical protein DAPPUDRAFT_257308 [Daphnia pulex]|uniref:Uncharacterized protein n=1 Tax=Daphnia pulex TaxID=6669 RepID=E9HDB5_DAPPU|nr:hypothetical protein DAPPUDRAFT_257308 [Daphnia pulex]|eukprot:EFX70277.1 hypothetical protein DAPPUDRAFT_257308 [Daphnia pulex]
MTLSSCQTRNDASLLYRVSLNSHPTPPHHTTSPLNARWQNGFCSTTTTRKPQLTDSSTAAELSSQRSLREADHHHPTTHSPTAEQKLKSNK